MAEENREADDGVVQLSLTVGELAINSVIMAVDFSRTSDLLDGSVFRLRRECVLTYDDRNAMETKTIELLFRRALIHGKGRGFDNDGLPIYSDLPKNIIRITDEIIKQKIPKVVRTVVQHGQMGERTKLYGWSLYAWGKMMIVIWGPKPVSLFVTPNKTPTKIPIDEVLVVLDDAPVVLGDAPGVVFDEDEVYQPSFDVEDEFAVAVCIFLYIQCPHHLSMYLSFSVLLTGTVFGDWVPRFNPAYNRRKP